MFGFFSNSISAGERPSIKQTITQANLTAIVTATQIWYDMSSTGTNYVNQFVQASSPATPINSGTTITKFINRVNTTTYTASLTGTASPYVTNAAGTLGAVNFTGGTGVASINMGGSSGPFSNKPGMTCIMVAKPGTIANGGWICGSDNGPEMVIKYATGAWQCQVATATGSTTIPLITTAWQIFSFVFDGGSTGGNAGRLRFRYNKADQVMTYSGTASGNTNNSLDNYYIGANTGGSNPGKAQIGEFFIWNRALKPGEVTAIETYLGTKWGI